MTRAREERPSRDVGLSLPLLQALYLWLQGSQGEVALRSLSAPITGVLSSWACSSWQ